MAAGRIFQAINRSEAKTILAAEVLTELTDRLHGYGDTELDITFDYRLSLSAYPAETDNISKKFTGKVAGIASLIPKTISDYVKAQLDLDSSFAGHLTFPKVTWDWTINLVAAREQEVVVEVPKPVVSNDGKNLDLLPLSRLTPDPQDQPKDLAKLSDPHSEAVQRATNRMLKTGVNEGGTGEAERRTREIETIKEDQRRFEMERNAPSALEERFARLEKMIEGLASRGGPVAEDPVDRSLIITAEQAHRIAASRPTVIANVPRLTPTGLEITGGARPSPGADAANSYGNGSNVGTVQGKIVVERMAVDVEHPSLEAGGAGAPDALRRQHGLAIPSPTEVRGGGVVDLPGVF